MKDEYELSKLKSRKNPYARKLNQAITKGGLFGVGKLADAPNDPMKKVIWERLRAKHCVA